MPQVLRKTDNPSDEGMSAAGLDRAGGILDSEIKKGTITAGALVVARRNAIVYSRACGSLNPTEGSPEVKPDSIFLLASITKPVTACAMMLLVERGEVSLDDPASMYLPELQGHERKKIRVRDLLSHTSGMPDMLPQNRDLRKENAPLSEFVKGALTTPLLYTPGTDFKYQSMGILLAAEIVERVSGMPLRQFEKEELFDPLGMAGSALGMGDFKIPETVWCGTSSEEPEEEKSFGPNSPYWRDMGHPWGGMHSTARDLTVLFQTILNQGEYGGKRIFSPATVQTMTADQNTHLGRPWGLGWALARSRVWNYFGELVSPATFGHTGATGTVAWADPERELICVVLTNRMVEKGHLLRRVSNAVSAAVVN
jgi:CubicO group peptidase (beta-lactamase class C family)